MMAATKKMVKRMISFISAVIMAAMMAAYIPANAAEELTDDQAAVLTNEIAILVNEARKEAGLKPLYVLPYLGEVAEIRAVESSESFSHSRKDGSSFASTIDTNEVPYGLALENLAGGFGTAEETFNQWKNSSGHWANIMNPDVTHMGIGVYYDENSAFGWYWQQVFVATSKEFEEQYLPSTEEIVPEAVGDVTGDGVVDTFDYLLLTDYLRKKKTDYPVYFNEAQINAADCFGDGIVSEADAKVMARYILGEYTSLPFVF